MDQERTEARYERVTHHAHGKPVVVWLSLHPLNEIYLELVDVPFAATMAMCLPHPLQMISTCGIYASRRSYSIARRCGTTNGAIRI
jgi:hypothetical protein